MSAAAVIKDYKDYSEQRCAIPADKRPTIVEKAFQEAPDRLAADAPTAPGAAVTGGSRLDSEHESAPRASDRAFLEFQPSPNPEVPHVWEYPDSDDGRAACFLAHFGGAVRFVPELNQWRVWHGHRWHADTSGRAGHFCQILSRWELRATAELLKSGIAKLAAQMEAGAADETKPAKKLKRSDVEAEAAHARRCAAALGNERTITALLAAAARVGSVIVPLREWDADPMLTGTINGTLDLRTRTHRAGDPADLITKHLDVVYDAGATAPNWLEFIRRILPDNLADYVQRLAGYALTGRMDDQAFYLFYGTGKNGKSILLNTLAGLFGDYSGKAPPELIEEPRNGAGCKANVAQLPGVRLLVGDEVSEGARVREGLLKGLTGGDELTGEPKYCAPFRFQPVAKLFLMGNHKPRVAGNDAAIWRRVRLIPFTTTITDAEEIPASVMMERFRVERPGVLLWLLDGLRRIPPGGGGIDMPVVVRSAVAEYREAEDDLAEFLNEATQDAGEDYRETKVIVFGAYRKWAAENGVTFPMSAKTFTRRLGEREGWQMDPGRRCWMRKSIVNAYVQKS